jgi:hypothetical protein
MIAVAACVFVVCFGLWWGPVTRRQAINEIRQIAVRNNRNDAFNQLGYNEADHVLKAIRILVPQRTYRGFFDFRAWHAWKFGENEGIPIYLVFEADTSAPHPSSTGVRLTLLDDSGEVLAESAFTMGHRLYLRSAELVRAKDEAHFVIALKTGSWAGPGPGDEKQYYARIGDRFDLVRLEGDGGKAIRNPYCVKHFRSGPEAPQRTAADWQTDLLSSDRLKVLRALVWLGGEHWDLKGGDNTQYENADDVQLVHQVRADPKVVERLTALAKREDAWLQDAAVLALSPEDTHFGP